MIKQVLPFILANRKFTFEQEEFKKVILNYASI